MATLDAVGALAVIPEVTSAAALLYTEAHGQTYGQMTWFFRLLLHELVAGMFPHSIAVGKLNLHCLPVTSQAIRSHATHFHPPLTHLCLLFCLGTRFHVLRPVLLLAGIVAVGRVPAAIELRLLGTVSTPLLLLCLLDRLQSLYFTLFPSLVDGSGLFQLQAVPHLAQDEV